MLISEVKKKTYSLTGEEVLAIKQTVDILETISNDDEICEAIQSETWCGVWDPQDLLNTVLSFDGTDILDY